jgi:HPr kinase/phosphorylase
MTIHATAVAINGYAIALRGKSGAGKSDLALRLLALPREALRAFGIADCNIALIADDRVAIEQVDGAVFVSAPPPLRGKLEVRGLGIVDVATTTARAPLALIVDLVPASDVPRLPDPQVITLNGVSIPRISLAPFEAATPIKIAVALAMLSAPSAPRRTK